MHSESATGAMQPANLAGRCDRCGGVVSNLITRPVPAHGSTRAAHFLSVRSLTEQLAEPLSAEDQTVQSMPDASPTKWHLAHTTWFFETFLLRPYAQDYRVFDPAYEYLFNSYYEAVGPRHPRPQRGMITRPGVGEILAYRRHVSDAMAALLTKIDNRIDHLVELGLHHEQQHQELLLMDAKHLLAQNPLKPAYQTAAAAKADARPLAWRDYLAFMEDGGYRRPEFWLSAGWDCVGQREWQAPLYWERDGDGWQVFTLSGLKPVDPVQPVCHVSAYEAAAFAKWAGKRLPREQEWETGAGAVEGIGQVWEWSASPYVAYPGYREPAGAIGEYNGKFMANQMVLRGGCAATPVGHMRTTYRNFFPPDARWMFGGLRLAEDLR
jgi:hypothetical protein